MMTPNESGSSSKDSTGNTHSKPVVDHGEAKRKLMDSQFFSTISPRSWAVEGDTSSFISVVVNTINALLGVSLFAMPWGFKQSGIYSGAVIVLIVALCTFETARILLLSQRYLYITTGKICSFPEIALSFMGPFWESTIRIGTIISCLGGCIGYLIFLSESIGQLFDIPAQTSLLLLTCPLVLLSWIRSFKELTFFTIAGVLGILFTTIALIYEIYINSDKVLDNFSDVPLVLPLAQSARLVGPATFMFTIHYCVLSIGAEVIQSSQYKGQPASINHSSASRVPALDRDRPDIEGQLPQPPSSPNNSVSTTTPPATISSTTSSDFTTKALFIAYLFSVIFAIIIGASGLVLFNNAPIITSSDGAPIESCAEHVCQNILLNLPKGLLRFIAGLSLCVSVIVSYIILLVPAREHIEKIVLEAFPPSSHWAELITTCTTRTALVVFTALAAFNIPFFGTFLGLVGGLTDSFQSLVIPPIIIVSLKRSMNSPISKVESIINKLIIAFGCSLIIYTIISLCQLYLIFIWGFNP